MNISKIKFSQKQINQFKKMGVETVYLFGSQAQGFTHPLSDVDIGVVFENPEKYKNKTMEPYLKLDDIFSDIFPKKQIDVVFLQFTPLSLQFNATRGGKVLYEKNEEKRFCYQEDILKRYLDAKYFYDLRYKAILERM